MEKSRIFYAIRLMSPKHLEHRGLFGQGQWYGSKYPSFCTAFIFENNVYGYTVFFKTFEEARQTREKLLINKSYSSIVKITETENSVTTKIVLKGEDDD